MPRFSFALAVFAVGSLAAQQRPTLDAPLGRTPTLDGRLSPGEYADASPISGVLDWVPQFSKTTNPQDLALKGWVKHDGKRLYFAFEISDDVLYGLDTPRWLPGNNPKAHQLTREGWPWFGDEMEILLNATNRFTANEPVEANGRSWQMVCNLTKSRLGGVGTGGILEGEPRAREAAWNTYAGWIQSKAQECVARVADPKSKPRKYVLEWAISFNPCVEVAPGQFWSPALGDRAVGLNLALGDLDEKERGAGNFGNFHHEDWWAGAKNTRTQLNNFGTLWLRTSRRP
ncbi:MAG: hypothetical protein K2Q23_13835 [Bryobacteraceae bacterium]|nr:hypothetical protein [Bryobacteraceae bacterium]